MIATSQLKVIVGAGITGVSVARFLARQGQTFRLLDTRSEPPNLEALRREFGGAALELGELDPESLLMADEIIVSPGVPLSTPALQQASEAGIPILGDIELFARHARAPLVAITGSNAKSTVTTLVGDMARCAGVKVAVGGNLGTPALDLLDDKCELYVLELSSFQLETVSRLNARVACILNVSADHLDRYASLQAYHAAKLRIYYGAEHIVINRRDLLTHPPLGAGVKPVSFGGPAEFKRFGIIDDEGEIWLAWQFEPLLKASELNIKGSHNIDNALAALAIGHAAGLPFEPMIEALKTFKGLPHRCEWVATINGVDVYNDSKGTNVGATLAAINGLAPEYQKLILIAGGEGKGADFRALRPSAERHLRSVVLFGRDAGLLADALEGACNVVRCTSLQETVERALESARSGDAVLLSPACASFDMFANYQERGEQFRAAVRERAA